MTLARQTEPKIDPANTGSDLLARLSSVATAEAGLQISQAHWLHLQKWLRKRIEALNLPSLAAYCRLLEGETTHAERTRLSRRLLTHTTSFFRDQSQHDWLGREGFRTLVENNPARTEPLQVWSSASSTGEELYSVMIMAAEAAAHSGRPWLSGEGTGTDFSADVLQTAENAIYPYSAIDPIPEGLRRRFVLVGKREPRTIRIADSIRRRCQWQVANLIRPQSFPQTSADIILVRNVLIYFPVSAQAKVMRDIIGRLRPGGLLLTGPNESSIARAAGLTTLRPTIHRKDTR